MQFTGYGGENLRGIINDFLRMAQRLSGAMAQGWNKKGHSGSAAQWHRGGIRRGTEAQRRNGTGVE